MRRVPRTIPSGSRKAYLNHLLEVPWRRYVALHRTCNSNIFSVLLVNLLRDEREHQVLTFEAKGLKSVLVIWQEQLRKQRPHISRRIGLSFNRGSNKSQFSAKLKPIYILKRLHLLSLTLIEISNLKISSASSTFNEVTRWKAAEIQDNWLINHRAANRNTSKQSSS